MNIAKWDDEFIRLWNTPCHTPAYRQGVRLWQIILEIRLRTIIILIFPLRRRDFM